jgi:hypothetical protein
MKTDTVKEIELILSDYFTKGSSQDIDGLLLWQDRLSIHSYRLAQMTADSKTIYNGNYFIRKITVNKQQQSIMATRKLSKAQANLEADILSEELFKKELESEGLTYKYEMLLNQVNKILSAMQQRISYLKTEKNQK